MRPPSKLVLAAALTACLTVSSATAQDDAGREARLLALEGKFREADGVIARAPAEVQKDPALHLAIGETAMKFSKTMTGEERRELLFSARQHFAAVIELKADDAKAAAGVIEAAKELAQLDMAGKKFDEARAEAKFAIESGEKALAAGVATTEFKTMLGRMFGLRASFVKSMKDVETLVSDSTKGAALLSAASAGAGEQTGKLLSEASAMRLSAANLIHEGIPKEEEKRDDEALAAAIELATQSCNVPNATENDFATHLAALRLAHTWGMKLAQKPFMTLLGPPLPDLKLALPRSGGWVRGKSPDWDLLLERNLKDPTNDGTVQIMLKRWESNQTSLGKTWNQLAEVSQRRFDKYKEDQAEIGSTVDPVQLAGGKNAVDLWHYEVGGKHKNGRIQRIGEWIWFAERQMESVWQMKIIDWRPVPDIQDPDIVAFVASAIGEGLWPPGSGGPKDDPKKPPKKKKK